MSNTLRKLDLNLLVTLDTLLLEQNVTRAAERLSLSQPSVSVQLAKLREIFQDPLLLPAARGMLPTARARELHTPLREALSMLERTILPVSSFDPSTATQTWQVMASDYSELTILLSLISKLSTIAPNTRLAIHDLVPTDIVKQTEQGIIDLAFHIREDAPDNLHQRLMFQERSVLAGRIGHPFLTANLTLSQFCQLEYAIVSPDGGGFHGVVDTELSKLGLMRRVVLSVPHFLFLMNVLENSDLVAILPARLVQNNHTLQMIEPPINVSGFDMLMLWHERVHRDPAHQWLREQIIQSCVHQME
ncbi:LysR family transcriptional regulator [Neisseria sp. Ec49-e6-T10]|uniref:LysR family transcriptional regulator n=1 Tax=Neisseria sp. Ec49-e6-T10 TaxID=3140744 RepID=UPI003EB86A92